MKCTCVLTHAVAVAVSACVSCVMLTATVLGHDAAFLSLLFQRPRFLFYCSCSVLYVYVCVRSNLPPHTLESQKRGTNGFIAKRKIFLKGDLAKNVSFKSYGVIC